MKTIKVYTVGCSWMWDFNEILRKSNDQACEIEVEGISMTGQGANEIYNYLTDPEFRRAYKPPYLESKAYKPPACYGLQCYDYVLVQLPTPIRSVLNRPSPSSTSRTRRCWNLFHKQGEAKDELIDRYKKVVLDINALHPKIVFYVYNVGGYPFRHPYDFGEKFERHFIDFLDNRGLRYLNINFEGRPGFARKEIDDHYELDKDNLARIPQCHGGNKVDFWQVPPEGKILLDAHPNEKANLQATKLFREYIINEENKKSSS